MRGRRDRGPSPGPDEAPSRSSDLGGHRGDPAQPHARVGSPHSSAHPREPKLEPLRGLMSCLSSGLGPVPQRSGLALPRRTPAATAQPASALKI